MSDVFFIQENMLSIALAVFFFIAGSISATGLIFFFIDLFEDQRHDYDERGRHRNADRP